MSNDTDTNQSNPTKADKAGELTGTALRKSISGTEAAIGQFIDNFLGGFGRAIPFRQKLFKGMAVKGLEKYHSIAGGDAIGLVALPGQQLKYLPIKYISAAEAEEGQKPGWKAKSIDKTWNAGSEGRVVDYLGKTPIVLLDEDDHVEAGWLKPRIAEAIELDNYDPVFTQPVINPVFDVSVDSSPGVNGAQPALSDGGVTADLSDQINITEDDFEGFEVSELGAFASDSLINLSSGVGYTGMRISHRKADEWAAETSTSEEMQHQEDRGYIRGKMHDSGPDTTKLLLICAAIILGTMFAVFGLPVLLGGDSVTELSPLFVGGLA